MQAPQLNQQVTDDVCELAKRLFGQFLETFEEERNIDQNIEDPSSNAAPVHYYKGLLNQMAEKVQTTMPINFQHLRSANRALADTIEVEYYRVEPYLCAALQTFAAKLQPKLAEHRVGNGEVRLKDFYVAFYNMGDISSIRDLRTNKIGTLMSIAGTVTRTSQVRPELIVGVFQCNVPQCRTIIRNVKQQFAFTEPPICPISGCNNRTDFTVLTDDSVFIDWQQIRVQENADKIPAGSMPRSVQVVVRHEAVEKAKPGDKAVFTGTLIVVPDVRQLQKNAATAVSGGGERQGNKNDDGGQDGVTGLKALGVRDLTYKLMFLATTVRQSRTVMGADSSTTLIEEAGDMTENLDGNADAELERLLLNSTQAQMDAVRDIANLLPKLERTTLIRMIETFTGEQLRHILDMQEGVRRGGPDQLVKSIAPNIIGHEKVKMGVLLMLLGGIHKTTDDGQNLRGDINVCIVGDPSTSKSQFLKYVCTFVPRAVYTSGKASSAAGLTASVSRDPENGEFTIEAGALMLADNGICCIDEFDKMDPKDQVAIHEAMEQQTISIAKAGIQATLNARASILAAANPIYGRYDKSRTLKQNVDISPPIMSRFDLFFVVLDESNPRVDYNIAKHIVDLHWKGEASLKAKWSGEQMKQYVQFAKMLNPKMSEPAGKVLVNKYEELRSNDSSGSSGGGKSAYRITVRQLESLIRLSEAMARLNLRLEIQEADVNDAYELLKSSIITVETANVILDEGFEDDNDDGDDGGGGGGGGGGDADMGMGGDADEDDGDDHGGSRGEDDVPRRQKNPTTSASGEMEEVDLYAFDQAASGEAPSHADDVGMKEAGEGERKRKKEKKKKKEKAAPVTLNYDEYKRIGTGIILMMRATERKTGQGVSRLDIYRWYVNQIEQQMAKVRAVGSMVMDAANVPQPVGAEGREEEKAIEEAAKIIRLIVKRMVQTDATLYVYRSGDEGGGSDQEGEGDDKEGDEGKKKKKKKANTDNDILLVNSNFDLDSGSIGDGDTGDMRRFLARDSVEAQALTAVHAAVASESLPSVSAVSSSSSSSSSTSSSTSTSTSFSTSSSSTASRSPAEAKPSPAQSPAKPAKKAASPRQSPRRGEARGASIRAAVSVTVDNAEDAAEVDPYSMSSGSLAASETQTQVLSEGYLSSQTQVLEGTETQLLSEQQEEDVSGGEADEAAGGRGGQHGASTASKRKRAPSKSTSPARKR